MYRYRYDQASHINLDGTKLSEQIAFICIYLRSFFVAMIHLNKHSDFHYPMHSESKYAMQIQKQQSAFADRPFQYASLNSNFNALNRFLRLDNLLHSIQENISMVLLEDQHGPQSHSTLSATTNINTHTLRLLQELIPSRAIERNESSLTLSSQVLELARIELSKALDTSIQVISNLRGVVDEIQTLDLLNNGAEEERACRVAHPGVELAVWLVGAEFRVTEVVACCLGLLGECHHVGWGIEVPVVVSPELAGCADAGLDFVDDEEDVVFLGESA